MPATAAPLRTRLTAADSRATAIRAARAILIEHGPQALTLKAVAARIGKSHANLLHHFGSVAELQQAVAVGMTDCIVARLCETGTAGTTEPLDLRRVVELTFDAFDVEGAGALVAWMIQTDDQTLLDPIVAAVHRLLAAIVDHEGRPVRPMALSLVLMAFGDALLGGSSARALGLPRWTAREMAVIQLLAMAIPGDEDEAGGEDTTDDLDDPDAMVE